MSKGIIKKRGYYECSLFVFLKRYPWFKDYVLSIGIDITDPDYICRFNSEEGFEIGYQEDSWGFFREEPKKAV